MHEALHSLSVCRTPETRFPLVEKGIQMNKEIKPIRISASVLDDTFYVIEYATSENAKETAYEKIKRLIMNEPITLEKEDS